MHALTGLPSSVDQHGFQTVQRQLMCHLHGVCRTYCTLQQYSATALTAITQNQTTSAQLTVCTSSVAYTSANLTSGQYLFAVVATDNARNTGRSSVYNVQVCS